MNNGFFTKKETESTSWVDGKPATCASCGLYKGSENPNLKPLGGFAKKILIITSSISEHEDRKGLYLDDKDGRWLKNQFSGIGISIETDCITVSSTLCKADEPTMGMAVNCRHKIFRLIKVMKPKLIICFGMNPVFSLIGHRWKKDLGDIEKWRGWVIPDQELGCWVMPMWDHRWVFSQLEKMEVQTVWKRDFQVISATISREFIIYPPPRIHRLKSPDFLLKSRFQSGLMSFDIEATGIKPYNTGHRIACCAIAMNEEAVYVFPIPERLEDCGGFISWLKNSAVQKVTQNMKYEDTWCTEVLKTPPVGWEWDTMLASHLLDNRPGVTGLKFQAYVRLGVIDYSSHVSQYLESKEAGGMNRVMEAMENPTIREELMTYCALDALYEYRLAVLQMKELNYDYLPF